MAIKRAEKMSVWIMTVTYAMKQIEMIHRSQGNTQEADIIHKSIQTGENVREEMLEMMQILFDDVANAEKEKMDITDAYVKEVEECARVKSLVERLK